MFGMSGAKWTPGPWFACHPDDLGETVARLDKIWAVKCNVPVASGKDDAHLIAAAPEMADALRQWQHAEETGDDAEVANARVARDAALSKARGES